MANIRKIKKFRSFSNFRKMSAKQRSIMLTDESLFEENQEWALNKEIVDDKMVMREKIRNERRILTRYNKRKQKMWKEEISFGEY